MFTTNSLCPIVCLIQSTLRRTPEDRIAHFHHGERRKSPFGCTCLLCFKLAITCRWRQQMSPKRSYGPVEMSWHTHRNQDFVIQRNRRVHSNRSGWASVQSTTGSRGVRISGSNAGYNMFRGSVKGTGYPLHSPLFPLHFPVQCVAVCHQISAGVYYW